MSEAVEMVIAHGLTGFQVFLVFGMPVIAYALGIVSFVRSQFAKHRNSLDAGLAIAGLVINGLVVIWALFNAAWFVWVIFAFPGLLSLRAFLRWRSLPL